jgi:phosphate:Na+ symporter
LITVLKLTFEHKYIYPIIMSAVWQILQIVGSLGIFIYGMKIMSEGLQKIAGEKLRNLLKGMTSNRLFGILTGIGITVLIQSSSATTVLVVGFVNAGLLSLTESFGVIMGANIGTTVTAWLLAIFGFKVKIEVIAIILIGIFFPFILSKNERLKNIAEFVIGFGILFIGLGLLKDSVPNPQSNPEALEFFNQFANYKIKYFSILLFVLFGTILTVVVQSSSAATAITLTLLSQNWITFDLACAMVLGENIGTTITANIAASVGNVHAKRSARFHFLFNVIGVIWMLIVFIPFTKGIYSSIDVVYDFFSERFGEGSYDKNSVLKDVDLMGMALFHTMFNVLNVLLLYFLVPYLSILVIKLVRPTNEEDEEFRLQYIDTGLMSTPSLNIENAKKEILDFAKLIDKMAHNTYALFYEKQKDDSKLIAKIRKREDFTDKLDIELTTFLAKISEGELSVAATKEVKNMIRISHELERMGDLYYELTKNYERLKREKAELPQNSKDDLHELMILTMEAITMMRQNLDSSKPKVSVADIIAKEQAINKKRKEIFTNHFLRLEKGVYAPKVGVIYIDFVNRLERLGDTMMNIHEAILDKSDLYEKVDPVKK